MDPVSMSVGMAVTTLLAKAWERAGDRAVAGAEGVIGRVLGRLRRRFGEAGDEEATGALEKVEDAPDSPRRRDHLAAAIDRNVAADPGFGEALVELLAEARAGGMDVGDASQTAWGSDNTQIQNVSGSHIEVHRGD